MRRIGVAFLAGVLLLGVMPGSVLAATSAPRSLVLKVGDLPHGFVKTQGRDLSNADMVKQHVLTRAEVRTFGRVLGYGENFRRSGSTGLLMVQSEVVSFTNTSGAHRYYLRIVHNNRQNAGRQPKFHILHVATVGDESTAFSYHLGGSGGGVVTGLVARRGLYLSDTLTFSAGSRYRPEQIITLGMIVDARTRHAK